MIADEDEGAGEAMAGQLVVARFMVVLPVVVLAVLVVVGRVDMVGILRIPPMAVKVRTMEDIRR